MKTQIYKPKQNLINNRIFVLGESVNNTRKKWNKNKYFLYRRDMGEGGVQGGTNGNDALSQIRRILEEQAISKKSRGTFGPWKF